MVGGKIIRDKLFFFGGYQQTVQRSNPGTNIAHVPTALTAAGNFSVEDAAVSAGGCQSKQITLIDPLNKTPFGNNMIPAVSAGIRRRVNLLSFVPISTDPCGTYLFGQLANNPDWQVIGRVDYVRSAKHILYGRYAT